MFWNGRTLASPSLFKGFFYRRGRAANIKKEVYAQKIPRWHHMATQRIGGRAEKELEPRRQDRPFLLADRATWLVDV